MKAAVGMTCMKFREVFNERETDNQQIAALYVYFKQLFMFW